MTEIVKILNKENLRYYVERMLNDKDFRKEVGGNCICVDFDIAVADPHAEECYINTTLTTWDPGDLEAQFEDTLNKYIPEQESVEDFLDNCQRLYIKLTGKNEVICVKYFALNTKKENKECE